MKRLILLLFLLYISIFSFAQTEIAGNDIILYGTLGRNFNDKFTFEGVTFSHYSQSWLVDPTVTNASGLSLWVSSYAGIKLFTGSFPRLTINSNGNIGIGTINPQNRLDVNGTIRAKEVKVETGWADFVFEEDYQLPTLEEVATHIKEKKHLPDIPSAKEVEENGISLGEMNAKLLQKIEELTLYLIKQDEEIKELRGMIEKQK